MYVKKINKQNILPAKISRFTIIGEREGRRRGGREGERGRENKVLVVKVSQLLLIPDSGDKLTKTFSQWAPKLILLAPKEKT